MIFRILYNSRRLTKKMNVFDEHYHTYRTIMKIVGLWPYNNSIYVWIQRLWFLTFLFGNIIFQVTKIMVFPYVILSCNIHLLYCSYFYNNNLFSTIYLYLIESYLKIFLEWNFRKRKLRRKIFILFYFSSTCTW